jgi:hypothetical protein
MLQFLSRKYAAFFAAVILLAVPLAMPVVANAASSTIGNCLGQGSNLAIGSGSSCAANNNTSGGTSKINGLITDIVNIFSAIVGVISVIMIIIGGFQYITSGGDSGKVGNAKNTIIYAVVGLVVVAFAQFIVQFVLNKVVVTS